jgi:hypothetical protein
VTVLNVSDKILGFVAPWLYFVGLMHIDDLDKVLTVEQILLFLWLKCNCCVFVYSCFSASPLNDRNSVVGDN